MKNQKSIKKNIVMNSILSASNLIFPLITYSYVARIITPVGTGRVAFVRSILQYFSYIAILGIPAYGLRECAKLRDDKEELSQEVQELLIINIISTLLAYLLLIVLVIVIPKFHNYLDLFLIMSGSIVLNTIGVEWLYQAFEEYSYITLRSVFFKGISVGLTFLLIRSVDDYIWYGFLIVFSSSASCICNFFHIKKYVSMRKVRKYDLKRHLKPVMYLFFAAIVITIYNNFDISMIGFISTESEVGLYNAALKIKSILLSIPTAITSVLIPRMAYYLKENNKDKLYDLTVKSLRLSFLIALPIAAYVFFFSKDIIVCVCGEAYLETMPTLRILMICIIPLILTNLFGNQILIVNGKEKRFSQSVFIGMWINLILNFIMIPKFGAFGAAIGTLIAEFWNVIWMSGGAKDYVEVMVKRVKFASYFLPLIISIVGSMAVYRLVYQMNILLRIGITVSINFLIYYIIQFGIREPLIVEQTDRFLRKVKLKKV